MATTKIPGEERPAGDVEPTRSRRGITSLIMVVMVADDQNAAMMFLPLTALLTIAVDDHNPAMVVPIPVAIAVSVTISVVVSVANANRYLAFFRDHNWLFAQGGPRQYRRAQ
jgi:hypothetical protein